MDVDTSLKILVIILSATLAVFLILSIVLVIKIIQIVNRIKVIIEKADALTNKAGEIADFFKNTTGPVAIGKMLANIHHSVFGKGKKGKE